MAATQIGGFFVKRQTKIYYVAVVIFWLCIVMLSLNQSKKGYSSSAVEAFAHESICLEQEECKITAYGVYRGEDLSTKEQQELLISLGNNFSVVDNYTIFKEENSQGNDVRHDYHGKAGELTLCVKNRIVNQRKVQYITTELTQKNTKVSEKMEESFACKRALEKWYKRNCRNSQVLLTQTGIYGGILTMTQKDLLALDFLESLGARSVMEQREEMYVVYGYTKKLSDKIKVNGEKVNVTLAITEDKKKNVTKIYMATPILNESF